MGKKQKWESTVYEPGISYETLKAQRDELLEALNIISRMSYSEMRQYCIDKKTHEGLADANSALLAQRIALTAIENCEEKR